MARRKNKQVNTLAEQSARTSGPCAAMFASLVTAVSPSAQHRHTLMSGVKRTSEHDSGGPSIRSDARSKKRLGRVRLVCPRLPRCRWPSSQCRERANASVQKQQLETIAAHCVHRRSSLPRSKPGRVIACAHSWRGHVASCLYWAKPRTA